MKIKIIFTVISLILFPLAFSCNATVYVSDHFDDKADWDGTVDAPEPWSKDIISTSATGPYLDIGSAWDDAHGSTGKSVKIQWPAAILEIGLAKWFGTARSEYWIGFNYKHDAGWDWGSEQQYKWFGLAGPGVDTVNFNWEGSGGQVIDLQNGRLTGNIPWDVDDASWSDVVFYVKHNTTGNADGVIRGWINGVEITWTPSAGTIADNYHAIFDSGASTWPSGTYFRYGFQSRSNWGTGNVSYWDDMIMASTQAEVETFLGIEEDNTDPETSISTTDPSNIPSDSLVVTGSSSDAVGVSGCKWRIGSAPDAGNGTSCTGTTSFSCSTSGYSSGANTAYVGCYDAAGNYGANSIAVNYTPAGGTLLPFTSGFETGDFSDFDGHTSEPNMSVVSSGCYAGTYCAKAILTNGTTSDNYLDYYFGDKDGGTKVESIELTIWTKIDAGYSWPTNGHKVAILNIYSPTVKTYQVVIGMNSDGEFNVSTSDFADWLFFQQPANRNLPATPVTYGQWHKLKVIAVMNTTGGTLSDWDSSHTGNGILRFYVDDELDAEYTDMNFREATSYGFNHMNVSSNANPTSPSDGVQYFDSMDLDIYTLSSAHKPYFGFVGASGQGFVSP